MAERAPWLDNLADHIGLKEIPGPQHNEQIVAWGKAAGIDWWNNDEDAWCAVAVNGALVEAGLPSTRSALARSFTRYGTRLSRPVRGAIVVFPRGKNPLYGHVGIVESVNTDGTVTIVNGNVSNMVKRSVYRISSILPDGIRWPPGAPMPDGAGATPQVDDVLGQRMLRMGMNGDDVAELQRQLRLLGAVIAADGIFGRKTRSAVIAFQDRNGLDPDGVAGPATLSALETAAAAQRRRDTATRAAANAAAPIAGGAAAGGVGIAVGVGTVVDTAKSVQSLNDGTMVGALLVLTVLIGLAAFFGYRFFVKRSADKVVAEL
ncbi:MAG: hypothetical protein AcusKO_29230 [Acuticoccus sp.]